MADCGNTKPTYTTFAASTFSGDSKHVDSPGDLTVDTSTLKVDSTNNRVGIGQSSTPDVSLDIR
jgi:hypothetical protein